MSWSLDAPEPHLAQALAGSLYRYFMYRFRSMEGRQWAERAVATSEEPTVARAKALLAAGTLAQMSLDIEVSMKHLDHAIDLARELEIDDVLAPALNNRANVASGMGMWEEAEKLYQEDLDLERKRGSKDGVVITLSNLADRALDKKDYALAIARAEETYQAAVASGSDRLIHAGRILLAEVYRAAGDFDAAEKVVDTMVGREEELGFQFNPGQTQFFRAVLAMDRGDFAGALPLFREALDGFRGIPDPYDIVWVTQAILWNGGRLLSRLGNPGLSAVLLGAADASLEAKGYRRSPHEAEQVEAVRADIRGTLGNEEFPNAYQEGKGLDPREAMDRLAAALDELS